MNPLGEERRERLEAGVERVLLALLVTWAFLGLDVFPEQPAPTGLARFVDLTSLAQPWIYWTLTAGLGVALALFVTGRALPYSIGYVALLWTAVGTLENSQGVEAHYSQPAALVLLAQTLAYAIARYRPGGIAAHRRAFWYSQQALAAAYFVSGITKLVRSRGRWLEDLPNIALQIVKSHDQSFFETLTGDLIARGDRVAALVMEHPNTARLVFGWGLALELFVWLALLGRRWALGVGIALFLLHEGIAFVMQIRFPIHEALVVLYFVGLPALLVGAWARRRGAQPGGR